MPLLFLSGVILLLALPFLVRGALHHSRAPLYEAGRGIAAGVAAGLVWGAGARVAMRIVALVDGRETDMSAGGTFFILLVGAIAGVPLGLAFMSLRRWLPRSTRAQGLTFGAVLLLLGLVPFTALGASDLESDGWIQPAVLAGTVLFSLLFLGYGLVLAAVVARLERRRGPRARSASLSVT